jgi:hypothetical protein
MLIVKVMAAPPVLPAVVSAPPAVVSVDAAVVSVAAVVPPVVPAVVAFEPLLSLPQDAAMNANPTASAAYRLLRFVILTWVILLCETEGGGSRSYDMASGTLVGKADHNSHTVLPDRSERPTT